MRQPIPRIRPLRGGQEDDHGGAGTAIWQAMTIRQGNDNTAYVDHNPAEEERGKAEEQKVAQSTTLQEAQKDGGEECGGKAHWREA
jgi:hypothetical protein